MPTLLDYPRTWLSPPPGPVLVVAPHADDEVIACGGILALHAARGDPVTVAIATDGAAGDPEGRFPAPDYVERRRSEARAAAEVLGIPAPEHWDLPDLGLGRLLAEDPDAIVERVREAIDRVRPATVYQPAETDVHPDHHALAAAVARAVEGHSAAPRRYGCEVWVPVHATNVIDVSAVWEIKRRALLCYESQLSYNDYVHAVAGLNASRSIYLPGSRYVEAFAAL